MKIKTKMAFFMIILLLVPSVFFCIFVSPIISDTYNQALETEISSVMLAKCDFLTYELGNQVNTAKLLSVSGTIRTLAEKSTGDYSNFSEDADFKNASKACIDELNALKLSDNSVEYVFVLNKAGVIVAGTDEETIGSVYENAEYIKQVANNSNGVSSFSSENIGGTKAPAFFVAKTIYSENNEEIGILVQEYNISAIQRAISSSNKYDKSVFSVIDGSGMVVRYPFTGVQNYSEFPAYTDFQYFIKKSMVEDSQTIGTFLDISYGGNKSCVYIKQIENTDWFMMSITEKNDIISAINDSLGDVRWFVFWISIIVFIAIMVFTSLFTRPLEQIVDVIHKRRHGDVSARFKFNGNDEFGEIGRALNSIFVDVFESERRYRTVMDKIDNIIFEYNYNKDTVFVSQNFNKKFSYRAPSDKLSDSFIFKLRIHKENQEAYNQKISEIFLDNPLNQKSEFKPFEFRVNDKRNDFVWMSLSASKFYGDDGKPTKIIGVLSDIDKNVREREELRARADFDQLTKLYNRKQFMDRLVNVFNSPTSKTTLNAVFFVDLDDFKHFNDEYGHACGDEVLQHVSICLKEIVDATGKGFSGRYGGDEFVVCLEDMKYFGDAGNVAQEIIDELQNGFDSDSTGQHLSINCSIGISFFHECGESAEEVIESADSAMYSVKKHGKSNFTYAPSKNKGIAVVDSESDSRVSAFDPNDIKPPEIEEL